MPSVDIQLSPQSQGSLFPGDEITGDVLITTNKLITLRKVYVELKGKLWVNASKFSHRVTQRDFGNEFSSSKENFVDYNHPHDSSSSRGTEEVDDAARCGGEENQRNLESNGALSPSNSDGRRLSTFDVDFTSTNLSNDKQDLYISLWKVHVVLAENQEIAPGLRRLPFSLVIPRKEVIPQFKHANISVGYQIRGHVETPTPVISWFSWTSHSRPLMMDLISGPSAGNSLVSDEGTLEVGEWDTASTTPGALMKYIVGGDTARAWHRFVVRAEIPSKVMVSDDMPYYLQKDAKLTATPVSVPDVDVIVRRLVVAVQSTVVVAHRSVRGMLEFRTGVLESKHPGFVIGAGSPVDTAIDLTALLSAAKIPTNLIPSVSVSPLLVRHDLVVRMELEARSPVNVKQKAASVELRLPLRVSIGIPESQKASINTDDHEADNEKH